MGLLCARALPCEKGGVPGLAATAATGGGAVGTVGAPGGATLVLLSADISNVCVACRGVLMGGGGGAGGTPRGTDGAGLDARIVSVIYLYFLNNIQS
ncbi:hypothetical protein CAL7716_008260 [Calothrix sp. PCC 7716]|nr:hypothetical protein CAL7716_008260 [Calothrix sp. PCC 7716]